MQAQKPATASELSAGQNLESVKIILPTTLFDRMTEIYQQIENRAFRFFEESGYQFGNDLEHWLRAEADLLMKVPVDITDNGAQLIVQASVPDFTEKEIQVSVEPFRLILNGNQKKETTPTDESKSEVEVKELFCSVDLPTEVKPAEVKTEFKEGVLKLTLEKVDAGEANK